MITLIIALLTSSVSFSGIEGYKSPFSTYDESIISIAKEKCENARRDLVSTEFLTRLLDIEKELGIPFTYRGMVLAAACNESGYNPAAIGDGGKAVGILQMWPWWKTRFGLDRKDPLASDRAWFSHILRTLPKAERRCGKRRAFLAAWSWVASGPQGWTCRAPRHYTRLRKWHRYVKLRLDM